MSEIPSGRMCSGCGQRPWRVAPLCDECWDKKTDDSYVAFLRGEARKQGVPEPVINTLNVGELEQAISRGTGL